MDFEEFIDILIDNLYLENLRNEHLMAQWLQNPYFQVFVGEHTFQ